MQSNSTFCPKHQTGKGHLQLRRLSNVNPETGPQYRMNLLYFIEVLLVKCVCPYRQNRYYQYLTGHPNIWTLN